MTTRSFRSSKRTTAEMALAAAANTEEPREASPEVAVETPAPMAEATEISEVKPKKRTRRSTGEMKALAQAQAAASDSSNNLKAVSRPSDSSESLKVVSRDDRNRLNDSSDNLRAVSREEASTAVSDSGMFRRLEVVETEDARSLEQKTTEDENISFKDLRREIVEARNLVIKTDNQVKTLGSELKTITKLLEGERRRGALASASAYIIFTILSFGGLYLFFNARLADLETQNKNLQAEKQTLTSEAKERASRAERSKVSEEAALQILRQLQTGEREKALKAYQELDVTYLTPLESEILRAEVERRREALAEEYFTRGKDYYRSKQYKRAEEEFVASMQIQKESSRRPEILYFIGMIHYNLGRFPDAAEELEKALAEDPRASWHGDAQYFLAASFEETKQLARAREGYLAYLKEFPKGFYSGLAKIKLANMK